MIKRNHYYFCIELVLEKLLNNAARKKNNMDLLSTIKTVFGFFAGDVASDGLGLTKDIIIDILNTRELIELLDQFDERFVDEHLTEISDQKINMKPVFDQRKDLIGFAEESMTTAFVDININRKDQFLIRACSRVGNSDIVKTYLFGFYDIVFMKETKCASDEDKAIFNDLSDQICTEFNRIDREIKRLGKRIGNLENGQSGQVDFKSFYDTVVKKFTEVNDDSSTDLVGELSAEESYIDSYIEVGYGTQPVLSYLKNWFSKKKYGTLLIHGEPGHGKSTLCKKAVFEYVNGRFLNGKATNVLTVSLNTGWNSGIISKKGVSYKDMLVWGEAKDHHFSFKDCRGALLFMDGFDEFVDDVTRAGEPEQDIVFFMDRIGRIAKENDIHIVVLSRTIAVQRYLQEKAIHDKCFSLAPISMKQQISWLDKHDIDAEYKERFKELQANENMRDFLGIPLLFRMIVHTRFDKVSSNVIELYDALFDHLMEKREIRGRSLQDVRQGLNKLAYEVYCYDTDTCEIKDEEWNKNWILAFYVKSGEGKRIGFFHRSFYQYFLSKYIYDSLFNITEDDADIFVGSLAERELDSTVRKYLSLHKSSKKEEKLQDNMGLIFSVLVKTEAYLNFIPRYIGGNAEKTRIGRSANITRNMLHIAASLSYVIQKPFNEGIDTLIRTFGGCAVRDHTIQLFRSDMPDRAIYGCDLKIYSEGKNRADLSLANLSLSNLVGVDISLANLSGANLSGADFYGANLSEATICSALLRRTKLNESYLICADLSQADMKGAELVEAHLNEANLSNAYLVEAHLNDADLSKADLIQANLVRANLSGANLIEANLIEANLIEANLIKANLSKANLNKANLSGANLIQANLSGADLRGAHIFFANLARVDLSKANLRGANLRSVSLREADLSGSDLGGVNLNGVDLSGANLSGCNLKEGCLRDTIINRSYIKMIDRQIRGYETIRWV